MIADGFLAVAAITSPLLRTPELADRWTMPSALQEFRVSGLAGHLANAVFNVERFLDSPVPDGTESISAVQYFLQFLRNQDVSHLMRTRATLRTARKRCTRNPQAGMMMCSRTLDRSGTYGVVEVQLGSHGC
ncbi:hypothetical protein [Saccharopolyspora sp. NPDC002376]